MTIDNKIAVGVVGGAGYVGGELLRLLYTHPNVELSVVVSNSSAGKPLSDKLPGFHGSKLSFSKFSEEELISKCKVVFLAQENGYAMGVAAKFLEKGISVIDLAADFRLKDPATFKEWYKLDHQATDLLRDAVYGLPEKKRAEIKAGKLIANPGCYPTATQLALIPLLENNLIDPNSIIVDAKSGVSGAGRGKVVVDYLYGEVNEGIRAYGVGGQHRHVPEIEQELSSVGNVPVKISFTPHLVPMTRGILATCYANLSNKISKEQLHELFVKRYANEQFVQVYELGQYPVTKAVYGSNFCHIGVTIDHRTNRVIVVSAIDNLVKGAAGQAIQNMNIILDIDENTGLQMVGMWP